MANSKKNDYYDILRVPPTADLRQIAEAIRNMRNHDKSGNYSAILNKIEETLTDPDSRAEYDFEQGYSSGPKSSFFDIDDNFINNHASNKAADYKYDLRQELAEYSVLSSKRRNLGGMYHGVSLQKVVLFGLLLLGALAAFVFSKPILDKWEGKKQAEAALYVLQRSAKQVEAYIRQNGYFPEALNLVSDDSRFSLRLESEARRVVLSFDGNVISELRNAQMINSFKTQPNITFWQCDIGSNFPVEFKPIDCY